MEGEEKGDGHQYGRKPRTPEPTPIAGNTPTCSEEEMGHWTPTGIEPMDYDDEAVNHRGTIQMHILIVIPAIYIYITTSEHYCSVCLILRKRHTMQLSTCFPMHVLLVVFFTWVNVSGEKCKNLVYRNSFIHLLQTFI